MNLLKRMKNRITGPSGEKGSSLAEMMTAIILVSMVSLICVAGLLFASRSTDRIKTEVHALEVGSMILDRISGELTEMAADGTVDMDNSETASVIAFTGGSGVPVVISCDNDMLLIHYRAASEAEEPMLQTSDWTFPEEAYFGYKLVSLRFTPFLRKGKLAVKTEAVLRSRKGKEFSVSSAACCINKKLTDLNDAVQGIEVMDREDILNDSLYI